MAPVRYATDLPANVLGGRRRGQAYAGELSIDVGLDLEKLLGLRGLTFQTASDPTLDQLTAKRSVEAMDAVRKRVTEDLAKVNPDLDVSVLFPGTDTT